jgi:DNA-directed RNA polymerase specialized sigma24 family protein
MTEDQALGSVDVQAVADIQNGNAAAETALYERYCAKVYYVALRESRSPQDAEDVRAETFLRVLQAIRGNQVRSAAAPSFSARHATSCMSYSRGVAKLEKQPNPKLPV